MSRHGEFDWHSQKATSNLANHGMAFEDAIAVFADPQMIEIDTTRPEDGEIRTKAVGVIEGDLFTVVFTMRGTTTWIISARRANSSEERIYDCPP